MSMFQQGRNLKLLDTWILRHDLINVNFIQNLFVAHPMVATAISVYDGNNYGDVDMAINGIIGNSDYDDMFHSLGHNYPWLAIDLGFYYKVILTVEICDSENILLHLLLGHRGLNGGTEWLLR